MLKRGLITILICLCSCLCSEAADFKMKPFEPTLAEIANMPEMCLAKWHATRNSSRAQGINAHYSKVFGQDWTHMHHYCFALNFAKRANAPSISKAEKTFELGRAVDNLDYVLEHTSPQFIWRGQTHRLMGLYFIRLGNHAEAQKHFLKAAEVPQNR